MHPGGSTQRVTNGNKMEYLTQLAQYRFVKSVSEEIRYFLKGKLIIMFSEIVIITIIIIIIINRIEGIYS